MDLGSLPDMAMHFQAAVIHLAPFAHLLADTGIDLWTAVTNSEAMGSAARNFQLFKIAGSTFGLAISVAGDSAEGAIGCAIADGEALMELCRAGHQYRVAHTPAL
jgi:hypothetical protein